MNRCEKIGLFMILLPFVVLAIFLIYSMFRCLGIWLTLSILGITTWIATGFWLISI